MFLPLILKSLSHLLHMAQLQLFRRLRWLYKRLQIARLRYCMPFVVLAAYTILGAYIFRHFELEADVERRTVYRESTELAFNKVLTLLMEIRCEDKLDSEDQRLQARHTKESSLLADRLLEPDAGD